MINPISRIKPWLSFDRLPFIGIFCYGWIELITLFGFVFQSFRNRTPLRLALFVVPWSVLLAIFIYSFIYSMYAGNPINKLLQQFVVISLCIIGYSSFFSKYFNNLEEAFKIYIRACYGIALLGVLQFVIYLLVQIDIFPFLTWFDGAPLISERIIRIRSICPEGGQLGTMLAPCLVYAFYFDDCWRLLGKRRWVILIVAIMSMALTAFLTLVLIAYFKYISKSRFVDCAVVAIGVLAFSIITFQLKEWSHGLSGDGGGFEASFAKFAQTALVLESLDNYEEIEQANTSTYVLAINFFAANNAPNRLFGTGLGSHELNYDTYVPHSDRSGYGLNREDGYSLLNRVYSEFGIVGCAVFLFAIFRNLSRKDIISFSVAFYFMAAILRGGYYWCFGVFFFGYLFFLAKKNFVNNSNKSKYENHIDNNCHIQCSANH